MKNQKLIGSAIFVGGALIAIKYWKAKPVKGIDVPPSEGGTTLKGLGIVMSLIGVALVLTSKKA